MLGGVRGQQSRELPVFASYSIVISAINQSIEERRLRHYLFFIQYTDRSKSAFRSWIAETPRPPSALREGNLFTVHN